MAGQFSRVGNIFPDVAIKAPCVAATTGNITLAGAQTIDGVAVGANYERVLVKDQTNPEENGIYAAQSGLWQRTTDASKNTDFVEGTQVLISRGTVNIKSSWGVTTTDSPIVLGTSDLTFALTLYSGGTPSPNLFATRVQAEAANVGAVSYFYTAGNNTVGDDGGALYKPASGSTIGGFPSADGAWWQIASKRSVRVEMFRRPGDADDTAAFQRAFDSASPFVEAFGSAYTVSSVLTMATSGQLLIGAGPGGATILTTSSSGHGILVSGGGSVLTGNEFQDFTLTRSGIPISGQDGIHVAGQVERMDLRGVDLSGHWDGFRGGITGYSRLARMLVSNNYGNGIHLTNADGAGGLQWQLTEDILCQQNNGKGLLMEAITSAASVGEIKGFKTFANLGGGAWFTGNGSGNPLQSVRMQGCFLGNDGNDGVYLDTYSTSDIVLEGVYVEATGQGTCGVGLAHAQTLVGRGINLSANQVEVVVADCEMVANSYAGFESAAARLDFTGNDVRGNCVADIVGERAGIAINAGQAVMTGNSSKGHSHLGHQIGVLIVTDGGAGGGHTITGNDFSENDSALASAVPLLASTVADNAGVPWFIYTPAVAATAGSLTSAAATGRYQRRGSVVDFEIVVTITTNGTCSGLTVTLPTTCNKQTVLAGRRTDSSGVMLQGYVGNSSNLVTVAKYDNSYPGADGAVLLINGHYETQ